MMASGVATSPARATGALGAVCAKARTDTENSAVVASAMVPSVRSVFGIAKTIFLFRARREPVGRARAVHVVLAGSIPISLIGGFVTMKLMAVLAHPDDESFGVGGTLAKYAAEGVEVSVVTATRGDRGRFRGHRPGDAEHPGAEALAQIREAELRAASAVLGVHDVRVLGFHDQELDGAEPREAVGRIVRELRSIRPEVIVTFGPDGAYGHPDHIAISQLTTAATVVAADARFPTGGTAPHSVSKLYYIAWPQSAWTAYESAVNRLSCRVDGVDRHANPWPDWAVTTRVDARRVWATVWKAVCCHESQVAGYGRAKELTPEQHQELWGAQSFYRVFSAVNGGRDRETDLFEGIR